MATLFHDRLPFCRPMTAPQAFGMVANDKTFVLRSPSNRTKFLFLQTSKIGDSKPLLTPFELGNPPGLEHTALSST
jgi:hypothetical protein